jgi:polyisoprenoid-binding protein YceI
VTAAFKHLLCSALLAAGAACFTQDKVEPSAQASAQPPAPDLPAGDFELVPSESTIWFVGIKDNAIAVPGRFRELRGALSAVQGRAWIEISIASLSTELEERDSNLRTHLFEADRFPIARLLVDGVRGPDSLPPVGGSVQGEAFGTLEIRSDRVDLALPIRISREAAGRLRVTTMRPLILTAEELGLARPLATLKAACGHRELSAAIPVEVDLVFETSERS